MTLVNIKNIILNAVFPSYCISCNKQGFLICPDCLSLIRISEYIWCPYCSTETRVYSTSGLCQKHQNLKLDGIFSATSYQEKLVKKLITNLKYPPYLKDLSHALAFLIVAHFKLTENTIIIRPGENFFIMPIPISKDKKKTRGYNQAELLANHLASYFKIRSDNDNLIKTKKTKSQVGLLKEERKQNLKGAFMLKTPNHIQGKTIFLVDDVFTTGSTMFEAAKTLKQAGAQKVYGIVVAREPLGN